MLQLSDSSTSMTKRVLLNPLNRYALEPEERSGFFAVPLGKCSWRTAVCGGTCQDKLVIIFADPSTVCNPPSVDAPTSQKLARRIVPLNSRAFPQESIYAAFYIHEQSVLFTFLPLAIHKHSLVRHAASGRIEIVRPDDLLSRVSALNGMPASQTDLGSRVCEVHCGLVW